MRSHFFRSDHAFSRTVFFNAGYGSTSSQRSAAGLRTLFGVWGALGTALGNLTADIISGYSPWLCVTGFAAQFLYGYIPFKLWYALGSLKEEQEFPKLDTARHVVKYLFIVAIDSLMVAGLLGFLMEGFGISQFLSSTTFVLLLNNFDFCILLGMPVIILVSVTGISVDVQKEKTTPKQVFWQLGQAFSCCALLH